MRYQQQHNQRASITDPEYNPTSSEEAIYQKIFDKLYDSSFRSFKDQIEQSSEYISNQLTKYDDNEGVRDKIENLVVDKMWRANPQFADQGGLEHFFKEAIHGVTEQAQSTSKYASQLSGVGESFFQNNRGAQELIEGGTMSGAILSASVVPAVTSVGGIEEADEELDQAIDKIVEDTIDQARDTARRLEEAQQDVEALISELEQEGSDENASEDPEEE